MKSSRSGLFLMEILITILFFSVAGTVCLQIYVKAHLIDKDTTNSSNADEWVQNMAESYYGCAADIDSLLKLYSDSDISTSQDDGQVVIVFDSDWNLITRSSEDKDASYALSLDEKESKKYDSTGIMKNAKITVISLAGTVSDPFSHPDSVVNQTKDYDDSEMIYSMNIRQYENAGKAVK